MWSLRRAWRTAGIVVVAVVVAAAESVVGHGHSHGHSHGGGAGHVEASGGATRGEVRRAAFSWSKLYALMLVFGVAMAGGLMAIRLQAYKHKDLVMELGNSLAGGIFLAAGMVHMLPEATAALYDAFPDLPVAPALCLAGMLLPLWVENVLMASPGSHGHGAEGHGHSHGGGGGHTHGLVEARAPGAPGTSPVGAVTSAIVPYLIALLLGIHSLIEGIALGVENSEARASMILLAVLCHKGLAAFSLGVALTRASVPLPRFFQVMIFFSLMTPVGGLLGALASASVADSLQSELADLILAFASGTFVYVGLVEIVLVEVDPSKANVGLKFTTVVAGACLMTAIGISMHG
ncbi:zinc transporter ZIP1 [Thecamonas trahens ATCC 50062]|uniref:Zinc transporter ZIP1 n=1 Tax=Thecamonas trahens ATCC 50062 TaxID=461836 RepID=A0A0L0DIC2_THETB|nr:zinc transporter ZIP1 [Thecamonas trahens ATCC 50062]KNC51990.1 zinc transporter ZIP1 [Thecamonas trahens ATCC 50062]|eukprot:XP_013755576.1 zinc transporter ZIP1 [Thecamonas trahens ATCC 50062]